MSFLKPHEVAAFRGLAARLASSAAAKLYELGAEPPQGPQPTQPAEATQPARPPRPEPPAPPAPSRDLEPDPQEYEEFIQETLRREPTVHAPESAEAPTPTVYETPAPQSADSALVAALVATGQYTMEQAAVEAARILQSGPRPAPTVHVSRGEFTSPDWGFLDDGVKSVGPWRASDGRIDGWQKEMHHYYRLRGWRRYAVRMRSGLTTQATTAEEELTVRAIFYYTNDVASNEDTDPWHDGGRFTECPMEVVPVAGFFDDGIEYGVSHWVPDRARVQAIWRHRAEHDERREQDRRYYATLSEDEWKKRMQPPKLTDEGEGQ